MEKNVFNEIVWVEQTVTYIETDGTTRDFVANGDAESIEIFMPEAEKIDVLYATDSIMDLKYWNVTLGVINDDGVLFVPEDAKQLVRDYHYSMSIKNENVHVILDWNTIDGATRMGGDLLLEVHKAHPEELTSAQKRVMGDNLALSINMLVGGEYVSQLGGTADVSVKTDDAEINVYYLEANGKTTMIESNYIDGDTCTELNHFSIYLYAKEVKEEIPIMIILAIAAVVILALIAIFAVIRRSKKA